MVSVVSRDPVTERDPGVYGVCTGGVETHIRVPSKEGKLGCINIELGNPHRGENLRATCFAQGYLA